MGLAELERRMRGWLSREYSAVLFEEGGERVAYALFRDDEGRGVHVRQFFVARDRRRSGVGRRAFELLVGEVLPPGTRLVVEVLARNGRALEFWKAVGFADYARTLERLPAFP
jgi:GNAT superfamily N-acetyltransferase